MRFVANFITVLAMEEFGRHVKFWLVKPGAFWGHSVGQRSFHSKVIVRLLYLENKVVNNSSLRF